MAKKQTSKRKRPRPAAKTTQRKRPTRRRPMWPLVTVGTVVAAVVVVIIVAGTSDDRPSRSGGDDRPFTGGDLHSLAVSPGDDRLYVGGHQAVAVSPDGGRRWRAVDSLENADAMGWGFLADRVLVGGHPGVSVSVDDGVTFEQANSGLPATDVHALGAGTATVYAASPQAGVFASADGGSTWTMRSSEAGQAFMGRIVVDPADDTRLWAADMRSGMVESRDGGRTWQPLPVPVQGVMWLSGGPDVLVASGMGGAAASRDGGRTWTGVSIPDGATLVEVNSDRKVWWAAAHRDDGTVDVSVSRDQGATWTRP